MLRKELIERHPNLEIEFSKNAFKFIKSQSSQVKSRIISKLDFAIDNPQAMIMLKGKPVKYKVRVGDMRIVLVLVKRPKGIKVQEIGNRGEIYKRLG